MIHLPRQSRLAMLGLLIPAILTACSSPTVSPLTSAPPPPPATPTAIATTPGTVQLVLEPPSLPVPLGDIFPIVVLVETGGQTLQGVQARLDYDPRTIRVEIIAGDSGPSGDLKLTSTVDDAAGHVDLELRSAGGLIPPGLYTVARVIFSVNAAAPVHHRPLRHRRSAPDSRVRRFRRSSACAPRRHHRGACSTHGGAVAASLDRTVRAEAPEQPG